MTTVFLDEHHDDATRRRNLFRGDLYLYSPSAATRAFCQFARDMIVDAFKGRDPEMAQHDMAVEDYASLLGELKPAFIHDPESKRHLQNILSTMGADDGETYFEVPKMRSSTSDDYLTTGIAYAWHPHRDTWYSAAQCQINWWIPVFDISEENTMQFFPHYFDRPIANSSAGYNYYEWNDAHRGQHVTEYINHDPRPLPKPTDEVDVNNALRVVCPAGGLLIFAGAHLHASVPNTSGRTRFSIDFRTVNRTDLEQDAGAPNVDSECTGTALNEFKSAADLSDLPAELIRKFEDGTEMRGSAVFPEPDSGGAEA